MERRLASRDRGRQVGLLVLVLALGLAGGLLAGVGTGGAAPADTSADGLHSASATSVDGTNATVQTDDPIVERIEYRLLPDQPDTVEARIVYEIPDTVTYLNFTMLSGDYDVIAMDGFSRDGPGTYEWDGSDGGGSVTIRHDVTESFRQEGSDEQFVGGTADWAIVARPQTGTSWNYQWSNPGLEYGLAVDGEGYAGERLAFLGAYSADSESVGGEQVTLVLPDAAETTSSPADILESISYASDRLRFGNRNEEVVGIAAPTGAVDWGPPGVSIGSDARVAADQPIDDPVNIWIHEYVHTRQYRDSDAAGNDAVAGNVSWIVEGSAEYYGARLNFELGHTDFATFRSVLERGTESPATDAVLAEPLTWADNDAEYNKGALVAGAIDLRLRAATNGSATLQDVIADWNSAETFTADDLEASVERHGDADVRAFTREHTQTDATPTPWDADTHNRYFGGAIARFDYHVVDGEVSIAGPYREGPLAEPLVRGETIAADVEVENVGDAAGSYRAKIVVAGQEVAASTGELSPGETATVELNHTFDRTGNVRLVVGDVSRILTVREPAGVTVTELSVSAREPAAGDTVDVRVTVGNGANRPAEGEVTITAAGRTIATERVQLGPGENTTIETKTSFEDPGEYTVSADGLSVNVSVTESDGGLGGLPGFTAGAALVGLLAALGVARLRRS